jgi:peptidoglycan/xylan/chitin deacetylase (PgdA/CDA1 family)
VNLLGGRYLLRFDDLCPTMDWEAWDRIEPLLLEAGVRPILAVVPDNRDPHLIAGPERPDFWSRVRAWQARGWTIGLHGYQHVYVNREPGILGLNARSEFAGLPFGEQLEKLRNGLAIYAAEGVRADAWIAPSHSFDGNTLLALKTLGIRTVSDGFAFRPFRDPTGATWVPQQFASMRPMPWGIWTFCYHINGMGPDALARFRAGLARLGPRMIALPEAAALGDRERSASDRLVELARRCVSRARGRRR